MFYLHANDLRIYGHPKLEECLYFCGHRMQLDPLADYQLYDGTGKIYYTKEDTKKEGLLVWNKRNNR